MVSQGKRPASLSVAEGSCSGIDTDDLNLPQHKKSQSQAPQGQAPQSPQALRQELRNKAPESQGPDLKHSDFEESTYDMDSQLTAKALHCKSLLEEHSLALG